MRLQEIAQILNGTLLGNQEFEVCGMSTPQHGKLNTIAVANSDELLNQALETQLSAVVLDKEPSTSLNINIIVVENCQLALIKLLELFASTRTVKPSIDKSASVDSTSQISPSAQIGPNVVIGKHCSIGNNVIIKANTVIGDNVTISHHCTLHANVNIYDNSQIGEHVIIHAGTVIGSDGFGYHFHNGEHLKLQHIGNVVIGDHVEIGANTTIDRATIGTTQIGSGSKIDNLVQIAHNVTLGKNNILCAYTGIAGSVTAGNNVIFAADVGVGDHVTIEDNVTLGPRTGIPSKKRLSQGTTWLGNPGRPVEKAIEQIVSMQRIPGMKKQMKKLQEKIKRVESLLDAQEN